MKISNFRRGVPVVAFAALLCTLAACDRAAPPLVSKAATAAGTPAVLLPPPASGTRPSTASVAGTVRTPTSSASSVVLPIVSGSAQNPTRTPFATPAQTFRYVVQLEDTLSGIAARFKTTAEVLVLLNNLPTDLIVPGQQLVIPGSPPTSTSTPRPPTATATRRPTPRTYVVKAGDSLGLIAKRYGTTSAILMRYNGMRNDTVYPGQILRIP